MSAPVHTICEYHYDIEQGTPEWHTIRNGVITASRMQTVYSERAKKTRDTYCCELACERFLGYSVNDFSGNAHTQRGHDDEPAARGWYEFATGRMVQEVGFVSDVFRPVGCSPDGLVGDEGVIEIKSKKPNLLVDIHEAQKVPNEYIAQIQGVLMVTNRKWCDFVAYSDHIKPFLARVMRDEEYITELSKRCDQFDKDVERVVQNMEGLS